MTKVGLISLGCAKNRVDSERALGFLTQRGYEIVAEPDAADVLIVNTCGFIAPAKEESINTILEMAQYKEKGCSTLVVTGCLAQRYREELRAEMPEVDILLGVDEYETLPDRLDERYGKAAGMGPLHELRILSTPRHFAYLRIAEGCDNRCSFCAIPLIRGPYQSRPFEEILDEAKSLIASGVQELILIAQDTTHYGVDRYRKHRLAELLRELSKLDVRWIRLLYAYPNALTDDVLAAMCESEKIVKYLDIPLQHVDDDLLKAMKRRSNRAALESLVEKIRALDPRFVLRTTYIAGFPGEGERAFEQLCDFVERSPFDRAGVFCYSAEEGTPAADYPGQVPGNIAQERADRLMALQKTQSRRLLEKRIGQRCDVVIEEVDEERGYMIARSYGEAPEVDGVIQIRATGCNVGDWLEVEIIGADDYDLSADIVQRQD